ncbi:MAG: alanine racemase [Candidatus Sumerlaeia bacterium]|nr:alanine racemase [Candidatus Sumerlaeia bacterium]
MSAPAASPTWAEISRSALESNLRGIRARVGPQPQIWPAVKANAYGHGAVLVSRWLREWGVDGLCVARASEGQELRDAGIDGPIALLTPFLPEQAEAVVRARLEPVVVRRDQIEALAPLRGTAAEPLRVHVKVDTGMGRVGLTPGEALEFCRWIEGQGGFHLAGICSHFPVADERDKSFSLRQIETFFGLARALRAHGVVFDHAHISNSAGIMDLPPAWSTLVRPGIMLYGLVPAGMGQPDDAMGLQPVLTLKTQIIFLKDFEAGAPVGYDGTHVTRRRTRVATLPVGYNDGYPWSLSGKGEVLVRGHRAPVVGRISMDYLMVDVGRVPGVSVGDEVVLIGASGGERVTVKELADRAGTIPYEILTRLGKRVARTFRGGTTAAPEKGFTVLRRPGVWESPSAHR